MWNQNSEKSTGQWSQPAQPPLAATFASSSIPEDAALIGKSLIIKGEVTGAESLYIDGKVEGSIHLPGNNVTIGRNGHVSATVTAREVLVQGEVIGNVNANGRLEVRSEGSVTGDAIAQRVSIEDGAFFKGKIDVRRADQTGEKTGESLLAH